MTRFITALKSVIKSILQPRPIQRMWQWIDQHVVIPLIVGSLEPGQMNTEREPDFRHLFDLYWRAKTRVFVFCKSARVGGTLFCICALLHKISTWPGPMLWMDPTRKTARKVSRQEIQPHMLACRPVAAQVIADRTHFTSLEMILRTCKLTIAGGGSAADLGGFQSELNIVNEADKIRNNIAAEASSIELAIARMRQFEETGKLILNSTPTLETGETWTRFLAGSQHYTYLPCPHCREMQRLTFFPEEKEVPFDRNGKILGRDRRKAGKWKTRTEKTFWIDFEHCKKDDEYDLAKVQRTARWRCGHCNRTFEKKHLNWMRRRSQMWAHNPDAPDDYISVHRWAGYSRFQSPGAIAKRFLQARGSMSKLHDFYNSDLGLPFKRYATALDETDIDRIIKRSPDYVLGQLPFKPVCLTMCVDVQGFGFWWSIRAWGILWDVEGQPTATALIDYGSAVSWEQIEQFAGITPKKDGTYHSYKWTDKSDPKAEPDEFRVYCGLIDSGFEAQQNKKVYEFCLKHRDVFSPSKGGSRGNLRGMTVTQSPVFDDQLQLVWYFDDHFKQQTYYTVFKENRIHHYLPRNIGSDYVLQVTSERTEEQTLPSGAKVLKWKVEGPEGNHLGDVEKEHEVLRDTIEEELDKIRDARAGGDKDAEVALSA